MNNDLGCDDVTDLIDAHVDGELAGDDRAAVAAHVAACADCLQKVTSTNALRERLRDLPDFKLPEGLGERILRQLPADEPRASMATRYAPRLRQFGTHALAAGLGAAAIVALLARPQAPHPAEPFVSAHVRKLLADGLGSVDSADPHGVRPWFAGKLPFAPPVAALDGDGYPLRGGYIDCVKGNEVAALNYARRQYHIPVFIAPRAEPRDEGAHGPLNDRGYNVVAWSDERFAYRAVSDLNAQELEALAARYRATLQPTAVPR